MGTFSSVAKMIDTLKQGAAAVQAQNVVAQATGQNSLQNVKASSPKSFINLAPVPTVVKPSTPIVIMPDSYKPNDPSTLGPVVMITPDSVKTPTPTLTPIAVTSSPIAAPAPPPTTTTTTLTPPAPTPPTLIPVAVTPTPTPTPTQTTPTGNTPASTTNTTTWMGTGTTPAIGPIGAGWGLGGSSTATTNTSGGTHYTESDVDKLFNPRYANEADAANGGGVAAPNKKALLLVGIAAAAFVLFKGKKQ